MSDFPPHALDDLSNTELKDLVVTLLGEVAELKQIVAEQNQVIAEQKQTIANLRDEVARLKGVNGRPDIKPSKPSGMNQASEKKARKNGNKSCGRGKKKPPRHGSMKDRIVKADVPEGSRFKGYEDFLVQDLIIQPVTTRFRRERWLTPDGKTVVAPLPQGLKGHFGAELRRFVLMQYHQGQVTVGRLVKLLSEIGIDISERQVMRFLNEGHEHFALEARAILQTGLDAASWVTVDDTGARHKAQNGYCTQIGNDRFSFFSTTGSKSRINFLELLRAGHEDYVINADALAYMQQRSLNAPVRQLLIDAEDKYFPNCADWQAHLDRLGITALKVTPDPTRLATEGALWGSISAHGLLTDTVIVSDDAKQFKVGDHALCWIHAERLVHKLNTFTDKHYAIQQRTRRLIWLYYECLKTYRLNPSPQRKAVLQNRFDQIFRHRTGFAALDNLLRRLHANKAELLMVLEHPEIPLHTNGSENDIRVVVVKRKISGGTRSDIGRTNRDTFLSLLKTCNKLGISFWDYLGDRLGLNGKPVPALPQLVGQSHFAS
ncbi:IS66 family transposase [Hoeflea sp.]|uniref:IS66 family transposase n=1 Tax=Hoeflea sp. TaxID=1940281 RepID=UPI003B02CC43